VEQQGQHCPRHRRGHGLPARPRHHSQVRPAHRHRHERVTTHKSADRFFVTLRSRRDLKADNLLITKAGQVKLCTSSPLWDLAHPAPTTPMACESCSCNLM
jgi:hypothetical protein